MMLATNSSVSFMNDARSASSNGKMTGSGVAVSMLRRCSHCPAKFEIKRVGPRVGEHALHLLLQHGGISQPALLGQVEQLIVGNAAPEEKRQSRGQLDVAHRIGLAGRVALPDPARCGTGNRETRAALRARAESRFRSRPPSLKLRRAGPPLLVKREERLDVGALDRAPERAARRAAVRIVLRAGRLPLLPSSDCT